MDRLDPPRVEPSSVPEPAPEPGEVEAATERSRRDTLMALRKRLAWEIDNVATSRDLPALARQLAEICQAIENIPEQGEASLVERLAADADNSRRTASQGAERAP